MACGMILVPQPEIEPGPPALEARSVNHWTTRAVPEEVPSDPRLDYLLEHLWPQPGSVVYKPGQGGIPGPSADGATGQMQEGGRSWRPWQDRWGVRRGGNTLS